jgi:hypothetical protein
LEKSQSSSTGELIMLNHSQMKLLELLEKLPEHLQEESIKYIQQLLKENQEETDAKLEIVYQKRLQGLGSLKGKIHVADDFDEPLEDFKDYM